MVSFGGGGGGTAGYLTGEKDSEGRERESVEVLIGDPSEVQAVADSLEFAHQSTTGVIAWAPEDNPTDGQIREVLQEFEKTAWAGLEPDRYAWSAVQHRDAKGGVHVHVFAARVDLETGKSLNIAPPGWEKTFGTLRDWQNCKRGWSRPDDPARARVLQQDFRASREASERRGGRARPKDPRKTITAYVVARIESGSVTDRGSLVAALKEAGLEVPRQGKNYITVRDPKSQGRWRLKGSIYGKDWKHDRTGTEAPGQGRGGPGARRADLSQRAEDARRELEALRQQRAEFHRARYGVAHPAPGRGPAADHSRGSVPRGEPLSRHLVPRTWRWCSGSRARSRASERSERGWKRRSPINASPSNDSHEKTWGVYLTEVEGTRYVVLPKGTLGNPPYLLDGSPVMPLSTE